jgi:hypothetical protein
VSGVTRVFFVFVVLGNFHDSLRLLSADGTASNLEHLPEESLFKIDHPPQNCPLGVENVRFGSIVLKNDFGIEIATASPRHRRAESASAR